MRCPTCPAAHGDASEVKDKNKLTFPKSSSLLEPGIEAGFPPPPQRCQSPALLGLRVVCPTRSTSMPVPHTPKKNPKKRGKWPEAAFGIWDSFPKDTLCPGPSALPTPVVAESSSSKQPGKAEEGYLIPALPTTHRSPWKTSPTPSRPSLPSQFL